MKKINYIILCLMTLFLIVSCDTSDQNKSLLYPPSWIQGDWKDDYNCVDFAFTSSNVYEGSLQTDFEEIHGSFIEDQTSNDQLYKLIINTTGETYDECIYLWEYVSVSELNYTISSGGAPGALITLRKQ